MLDVLRGLLGTCPPGLEFLEYIFGFILVAFGVFVVAYIIHLPIEFIGSFFHRRR